MPKFIMRVRSRRTGEEWDEQYDRPGVPEDEAQNIINYFNRTLRPGESPRDIVSVQVAGKSDAHRWTKVSMYTQLSHLGVYDIMECELCGITGKRFGLRETIKRDSRFRAKKYAKCSGDPVTA